MKLKAKPKQPRVMKLTKAKTEVIGLTVTNRVNQGMQAFVVAGAAVLQERHGWTQEQTAEWANETVKLGTKYLQLENGQ